MDRLKGILVAFLLVALSGAAYWFIAAPPPQRQSTQVAPEKQPSETEDLSSTQLLKELKKDSLIQRERYILERAASDWPRDLFERPRPSAPRETTTSTTATPAGSYRYSGYVEVDKKKLAIINGMQYQVGDQLESGKYAVRSIESEKVVLENVGKPGVVILPFVGGGF
jgi:hypothetical protein